MSKGLRTGLRIRRENSASGYVHPLQASAARRRDAEHNACLDIPTEALEDGAVKGLVDSAERVLDALYRSEPIMGDLKEALAALKTEGE